jgi:hypothetical protein
MNETIEKELLETERNAEMSIFGTDLFKRIYSDLTKEQGVVRDEIREIMLRGMKDFVKSQIKNTEPINDEAIEIAYMAGIVTVIGGDIAHDDKLATVERLRNKAIKRVIQKDNLSGYEVTYEDGSTGGIIIPKEAYELGKEKGLEMNEILAKASPEDKAIKTAKLMSESDLNKILDIAADKLINQDFDSENVVKILDVEE